MLLLLPPLQLSPSDNPRTPGLLYPFISRGYGSTGHTTGLKAAGKGLYMPRGLEKCFLPGNKAGIEANHLKHKLNLLSSQVRKRMDWSAFENFWKKGSKAILTIPSDRITGITTLVIQLTKSRNRRVLQAPPPPLGPSSAGLRPLHRPSTGPQHCNLEHPCCRQGKDAQRGGRVGRGLFPRAVSTPAGDSPALRSS